MKRYILWVPIILLFLFTGCNTASYEVQPTYVSSFRYDNKSCSNLHRELRYLNERVTDMIIKVDSLKSSQDTKLAFGWLFWPSYIIIDDNKQEAVELSRLKGESEALLITLENKKCKD